MLAKWQELRLEFGRGVKSEDTAALTTLARSDGRGCGGGSSLEAVEEGARRRAAAGDGGRCWMAWVVVVGERDVAVDWICWRKGRWRRDGFQPIWIWDLGKNGRLIAGRGERWVARGRGQICGRRRLLPMGKMEEGWVGCRCSWMLVDADGDGWLSSMVVGSGGQGRRAMETRLSAADLPWKSSTVELGEDDDGAPYWCSVLLRGTVNGVPAYVDFVF
ncbi:hypothetical protein ACLOJK_041502 [Asimina triloba]